jgi:hypothetical protein
MVKPKICSIEDCDGICMKGWEICESCAYDMGYTEEEIKGVSQ